MIAIHAHVYKARYFMSCIGVVDLGTNKGTFKRSDSGLDDLGLLVLLIDEELELCQENLSGTGVIAVKST